MENISSASILLNSFLVTIILVLPINSVRTSSLFEQDRHNLHKVYCCLGLKRSSSICYNNYCYLFSQLPSLTSHFTINTTTCSFSFVWSPNSSGELLHTLSSQSNMTANTEYKAKIESFYTQRPSHERDLQNLSKQRQQQRNAIYMSEILANTLRKTLKKCISFYILTSQTTFFFGD